VSEYFSDDDRVQVLIKWWNENAVGVLVGLVLVIGGVLGWRWYVELAAATEEAASSLYQHYLELRSSTTATPADRDVVLTQLAAEYRRSAYRIFTLFYRAYDAVAANAYAKASQGLETALTDAKDDLLRDVARVRLARLQLQLDKPDEALETLRKVGGSGFRSYVAELKGDILLSQGKRTEALEAYQSAAASKEADADHRILDMKIGDLATPNAPAP
jgi:predicted negative regulator of RcsB-dependent stress response